MSSKSLRERSCARAKYGIPVSHYIDILELAVGLKPYELELDFRRINMSPLFEKLGRKL